MGICDIWYEMIKSQMCSPLQCFSNVLWNAQVSHVLFYNDALALLSVRIDFGTKTIYSGGKCYYFNIGGPANLISFICCTPFARGAFRYIVVEFMSEPQNNFF